MATIVYVDGFNFYYGAVKGTQHKWLDLVSLFEEMFPNDDIVKLRYFTAKVTDRPGDPRTRSRQQVYLRALATFPIVEIHYGRFATGKRYMPRADAPTKKVQVIKTEEKGSDVNLASHLLFDAFRGSCDTAIVVSNDSDLAEPIRLAKDELGISVGIVNPHRKHKRTVHLEGTFYRKLRPGALERNQLPDPVLDRDGRKITKPARW
jgi:uncharacterized LabA/DUF88 family protein